MRNITGTKKEKLILITHELLIEDDNTKNTKYLC